VGRSIYIGPIDARHIVLINAFDPDHQAIPQR
jgi:hypothetical protein